MNPTHDSCSGVTVGWAVQGGPSAGAPEFQAKNKNNFPVTVGETFNRFADFRYKLHKNSLDGRALPGPAGGAIALPKPRSRSKGREEEGKGCKQGKRRGGKGRT